MPRMVCVRCKIEFRVIKNEVVLAQPDALWYGDLWKCPTCGTEVVAGIGREPFFEAYRGDVGAEVVRLWKAGAVIINEGSPPRPKPHYVPTEHSRDEEGAPVRPDMVRGLGAAIPRGRCPTGGPHSRVEAGTCRKCGEEGEALT